MVGTLISSLGEMFSWIMASLSSQTVAYNERNEAILGIYIPGFAVIRRRFVPYITLTLPIKIVA